MEQRYEAVSWDTRKFTRDRQFSDQVPVCRPSPIALMDRGSSLRGSGDAQQRRQREKATSQNDGDGTRCWTIRPPPTPTGSFTLRQSSPQGLPDFWASASSSSSRDAKEDYCGGGSDSDASMDAEVAKYTGRLGLEHKDACLPVGPRCMTMDGLVPIVTPPSRSQNLEAGPAVFSLVSPAGGHFAVTPSPTAEGWGGRTGHAGSDRSAEFHWDASSRSNVTSPGDSVAGAVHLRVGGAVEAPPVAKRLRVRGTDYGRCQTPTK